VILAGGRGTRFWPRSRMREPKQLLNIVGEETMLQQTLRRLAPLFPPSRLWVVTNTRQVSAVRTNLSRFAGARILTEPVGRNTAAAIGLAAIHLLHSLNGRDALMAVLPADHFIADVKKVQRIVRAALEVAARGPNLVVLGVPPSKPESGYGYIERAAAAPSARGVRVFRVARFTEKPTLAAARRYAATRRYFWNAGMFFWRVTAFLDNLKKFLPKTYAALLRVAEAIGTRRYAATLARAYALLENISVDYAVMEPASRSRNAFVLPADVGWSDIGSWAAVYDVVAAGRGPRHWGKDASGNVSAGPHVALDACGNFFWSPKKFVAAIGVRDLVVVETPDALLLCPRERAQDVGKVVKWLEISRKNELL
jgi:mannose-1-phosphate guanylyltransferase